ncbi:MAG: hypothetical protein ACO3JL_08730 [Myxococcota bacterium]
MPTLSPIHQRISRPLADTPAASPVATPSPASPAASTPAASTPAALDAETIAARSTVTPNPVAAQTARQRSSALDQAVRGRLESALPSAPETSAATVAATAATAPAAPAAPPPPSASERIVRGAHAYRGASTRRGPGGGNLACAYAVNNVLRQQGIKPLGQNPNYVPSMEQDLQQRVRQGGAVRVPPGQARPGDIVIAGNQSHVGIALGGGRVLSNSSSRRSFSWESGMNFDGYYGGGASRVYRLLQ